MRRFSDGCRYLASRARAVRFGRRRGVRLGANVRCGPGVAVIATGGGTVTIGDRTVLGTGTEVIATDGASVDIGADVFVGRFGVIAAQGRES